jgi:hypothetical protein
MLVQGQMAEKELSEGKEMTGLPQRLAFSEPVRTLSRGSLELIGWLFSFGGVLFLSKSSINTDDLVAMVSIVPYSPLRSFLT